MSISQTFTARCSQVGSFSYANNFTLYVVLTDRDGNSSSNQSYVDYNVYCQSSGSGSINAKHYLYFNINGETKRNETLNINASSPNAYIHIANGTITVVHDSDGNKTIGFSASINASSYGVSASTSGNFSLEKIPRYTNVYNSERGKTLNSISVNWSTSDDVDWVKYSINDSEWTNAFGPGTSRDGYYTVSGLQPNTQYKIRTSCRRADSGLWSEAGNIWITTYSNAYITSAPNFTDEENPTINYLNPFGENVYKVSACISLTGAKADVPYREIPKNGGSYTFELTEEERDTLRESMPDSVTREVFFFVITEYESTTYYNSVKVNLSIVNANPIFPDFSYRDRNNKTIALTGNYLTLVNGYSTVSGIIYGGARAIAQKKATMVNYKLVIGNQINNDIPYMESSTRGQLDKITSNEITMYAVDSRGLTTGVTKIADFKNYFDLIIRKIEVRRDDSGVSQNVILSFEGTFWNEDFGAVHNSIKEIIYEYKEAGELEWHTGSTSITADTTENTFKKELYIAGDLGAEGFDVSQTFYIRLTVKDELSEYTETATLIAGTPGIAVYKNNVAIGRKYDKKIGGVCQIDGFNVSAMWTYSTDEMIIGKWIDGKIIYRKVIPFSLDNNSNTVDIPHNVSNLDNVIECKGIFRLTKGTELDQRRFLPQFYYDMNPAFSAVPYHVGDNYISFWYGNFMKDLTSDYHSELYMIIVYTKKE